MPVTITDTSTEFVTLEEVKRHANITSSKDDDELRMIVGAAQEHVESLIGPVLHRTVVQTEDVPFRSSSRLGTPGMVLLDTRPVLSITSITSAGQPVLDYVADVPGGVVTNVRGSIVVTYMAGRTSCPDAVRMATLIVAAYLWRTQLGSSPSALPQDDTPDMGPAFGPGFERAAELLAPYMLAPGIA